MSIQGRSKMTQIYIKHFQDMLDVINHSGADRARYDRLVENMENDFLGQNNYSKTVSRAYHLLTNWKQDPRHTLCEVGAVGDGVSFATLNNNG